MININKKIITLFVFIALTISLIVSFPMIIAHEGDDDYDHHGMMSGFYGNGMWFGMWIYGWIFMILIIVAIILFIIWMIKQLQEPKRKI